MAVNWTTEHTLAFAPDQQVADSGKQLADARQWQSLGRAGDTLWGTIKGSGSNPYQVSLALDPSRPAFKCTCLSRKKPCKHVVGLAFLLNDDPAALAEQEPPPWVADWLDQAGRQRARQPAQPQQKPAGGKKPVDEAAQARRAAEREAKVGAGLEELEVWLRDLLYNGLASVQSKDYGFWDGIARRMVDAQAPGLAARLRTMADIPGSDKDWPARLLEQLGQLYLLIAAYKRIDALPPGLQAEARAQIGWTWNREELLPRPGVRDRWVVMGQRVEDAENNLHARYTWLWGKTTGKAALILEFAYGGRAFETPLMPGKVIDAELVYYPGAYPLRAIIKQQRGAAVGLQPGERLPGYATAAEAVEAYAAALACTPWLDRFPMALRAVRPVRYSSTWVLRDSADRRLHLVSHFEDKWYLVALSGGRPLDLFGEWDGERLHPLSAWAEDRFVEF
ncbi:MAG: SWIM zinc finger family protein [Anaerolineae bacterium]|nr:SWIM zinc finger family protein [Anaerolineae bacterium]